MDFRFLTTLFMMLESALKFQRAFERLEEEDPKYKVELEKLKGTPKELDWSYVESLVPFLKIFYDATMKVSGSLYVTSNDLFHVVYGIACMLKMETSSKVYGHKVMAKRMKAKHDKYWGNLDNINPLLFIAVVLDPRYKLEYVVFALDEVFGKDNGGDWTKEELHNKVKGFLDDMFKNYSEMRGVICASSSRSGGSVEPNDENEECENVEDYLKRKFKRKRIEDRAGETTISELERYLKANIEDDEDKNFDILAWWKKHSSEYPILGLMAKDVLAIPVSTVASESAFSTGGRVLDAFRSSLTPLVVESLICGQNWLRSSTLPIDMEEKFEEIEELEQELKEFCLDDSTIMSDLVDDD
ncbi:unnamed protein product [Linum trigynum]|uniref:Transposase n=1 Tax=Linum trigynum TaxID=586398 RepID=A0AAV2F0R8_9ROSI